MYPSSTTLKCKDTTIFAMSQVTKSKRVELQELTVYGWIRENCAGIQIPEDLKILLTLMYVVTMDKWDRKIFTPGITFNEEENMVTIKGEENWWHAFGTDIIKKGMLMSWKFAFKDEMDSDDAWSDSDNETGLAILIGIMEHNKISSHLQGHFIEKNNAGYAFYTYSSNIKHNGWSPAKEYGRICKVEDVVTMTFDMRQKESENGVLSFEMNDENYGVAFDCIDIEKEYCLTVEMTGSYGNCKTSVQIVA